MTSRIQKLALDPHAAVQRVHVPEGSMGLGLKLAGDTPTLWLLAPDDAAPHGATFYRLGTGDALPTEAERGAHIGMVQEHPGAPTWHYFVVLDAVETPAP